ncbi:MAG: D-tyrosyl-tRNA(Tyr) deacylase [Bacteroidales bacterium]|nr:D-tyrosyl-tRNA(Tyr) deacylase [Bacteroidales bacterium]
MRCVIQRVSRAKVVADGVLSGSIGAGLMILLGVKVGDSKEDADYIAKKVAGMRIFSDSEGLMNVSTTDAGAECMVVSQFTLFGKTRHGNRPSFIDAARPEEAIPLYEYFVETLGKLIGKKIATGVFGADMKIDMEADGPVTIVIDTENKEF